MTTTGPRVGAGYARWRPPSKVAMFLRRWWWVLPVLAATIGCSAMTVYTWRTRQAQAAAAAESERAAPPLFAARRYVRERKPQANEEAGAFIASLTDEQILDLAAGRTLMGSALTLEQRQILLRHIKASHTLPDGRVIGDIADMEVDSVRYLISDNPPGPTFVIQRIRLADGKRGTGRFTIPADWTGASP